MKETLQPQPINVTNLELTTEVQREDPILPINKDAETALDVVIWVAIAVIVYVLVRIGLEKVHGKKK